MHYERHESIRTALLLLSILFFFCQLVEGSGPGAEQEWWEDEPVVGIGELSCLSLCFPSKILGFRFWFCVCFWSSMTLVHRFVDRSSFDQSCSRWVCEHESQ